ERSPGREPGDARRLARLADADRAPERDRALERPRHAGLDRHDRDRHDARRATNGVCEKVTVKGTFPANENIFRLVSVARDRKSVELAVVGGSFDSGQPTAKLELGDKLTLVNTADGTRYEIVLKAACTLATPAQTTGAAATAPASATPVAPAPATTTTDLPATTTTTTTTTTTATTPIVTDSLDTTTPTP